MLSVDPSVVGFTMSGMHRAVHYDARCAMLICGRWAYSQAEAVYLWRLAVAARCRAKWLKAGRKPRRFR